MKFLLFSLLSFLLISCNTSSEKASETLTTEEITFTKEGELLIYRADSTSEALDIEFAETDYETATGLMYREAMEENQGMLFIFGSPSVHSFYMKNTEFSLDILYISKDQKLSTIAANAEPFSEKSLSSEVPIQYVLEINGSLAEKWNVKVGDSVSWTRD